jgi:hypothetical protein
MGTLDIGAICEPNKITLDEPGNTKGESIPVPLTSSLTGLD